MFLSLFWIVIIGAQIWLFYQFYKAWKKNKELERRFHEDMASLHENVRRWTEERNHS